MNDFKGRHFQGEIILWAVRWYCKYGISYRELEEMLEERGTEVDHTTLYRWVQHYGACCNFLQLTGFPYLLWCLSGTESEGTVN
jgi:transposase-like protein